MRYILLPLFVLVAGCGSVQKMAIRSSTPVFQKSGDLLMREKNWNFFKDSAPGNIKFLEMLALQDPNNLKLKGVLIKGIAGYAYAVPETLYFGDTLAGKENSNWKNEAIYHYTRALDYGLEYLEKKGINRNDLLSMEEVQLKELLKKKIEADDVIAILYTAQSWGSLINLQKDNIALVTQVPKVKLLFDRICEINPDIEYGVCDIFFAQYEASRPRMLGGNPEKAEENYQLTMRKYPKNLLVRLNYIQFMILPGFDEQKYEEQEKFLSIEFEKWADLNRDNLKDNSEYHSVPELNLFNAIAKKRFDLIEKNKKKIF
ncbi:MAG: TRAP transporter TatT component family protein [Bacteriovoracaceae bacterium]